MLEKFIFVHCTFSCACASVVLVVARTNTGTAVLRGTQFLTAEHAKSLQATEFGSRECWD